MLDIGETRKCLDHIKQIKLDHPLIDVHVHPFEVIFNGLDYQRNPLAENLYSSQQTDYVSPEIRESRLSSVSVKENT